MPDHAEKFDDYTFYLDDEFPDDLDESRAATHIGMFLAWAQAKGLIEWAEELSESDRQWFDRLGRGEASFGEMAESLFDGKLIASMLTDDGYEFTAWYYQKYLEDYFDFLPAGAPPPSPWRTIKRPLPKSPICWIGVGRSSSRCSRLGSITAIQRHMKRILPKHRRRKKSQEGAKVC